MNPIEEINRKFDETYSGPEGQERLHRLTEGMPELDPSNPFSRPGAGAASLKLLTMMFDPKLVFGEIAKESDSGEHKDGTDEDN